MEEVAYYFPWVRKGLGNRITEADTLGRVEGVENLERQRPVLQVTAEYGVTPVPMEGAPQKEVIPLSETKEVWFVSPGDITGLSLNAIMKVIPKEGSEGFSRQFYPYIEFWEPDFPWRYTPAAPTEDNKKLRPWLALLVCEKVRCSVKKLHDGRSYVTLLIESEEEYGNVFPLAGDTWRLAHAQGATPREPEFSRLIALRATGELKSDADYCAFLVPTFETGRLRGLGYGDEVLKDLVSQAPAWENSLADQKAGHPKQPLDFPVYYSWTFKTGSDSFDGLVEKLHIAGGFESDVRIDVSHMGEGLDYDLTGRMSGRKTIGMPAATKAVGYVTGVPFPAPSGDGQEETVYRRLKELVSKNPVFLENRTEISGATGCVPAGEDDPWVVPPVYGGKHIMAGSVDEAANLENGTPWLSQVNLDIHFRAAAGLGRKTVQIHQEELVNRAWKQVEAVNILNRELYQRLLSVNANKALKNKTLRFSRSSKKKPGMPSPDTGGDFIAGMMQYLGSMKHAGANTETSLSAILAESAIPQAFATASFQHHTDNVTRLVEGLDTATLMQNIANRQIFRMEDHLIRGVPTVAQLKKAVNEIYLVLSDKICDSLSRYFNIFRDYGVSSGNLDKLFRLSPKTIDAFSSGFRYTYGSVLKEYYEYYGYAPPQIRIEMVTSSAGKTAYLRPNVLVINGDEYNHLFGTTEVVTRVGGGDGLYFVSKSGLKQIIDPGGGGFSVATAVYKYFPGSGGHGWHEWVLEGYGGADYDPEKGIATYIDSEFVRAAGPCFFVLHPDKLPNTIQYFDTMQEYVEFLKRTPEAANRYLNEWLQLDRCVAQISEREDLSGGAPPQEIPVDSAVADELRKEFDASEAWERMRLVAETYYAEFFSNEELLRKYIDELLRSKYPILAYPVFPEPVYHYLKMFSDRFILPCVDKLSADSIAVFQSNSAFVEACLCGMNTEMGRELLWREYPTDQRGSYFRKFWDSETDASDIRDDNFFDIEPVHTWKGYLGENHAESKTGLLLFALKGRLMRQYPGTKVFLHKAVSDENAPGSLGFDPGATTENAGVIPPVIQAFLREDILLVGFKREFEELVGNPAKKDYGYLLAFMEDVGDLNFQNPAFNDPNALVADDAAGEAERLKNNPTLYGKHLSLFI